MSGETFTFQSFFLCVYESLFLGKIIPSRLEHSLSSESAFLVSCQNDKGTKRNPASTLPSFVHQKPSGMKTPNFVMRSGQMMGVVREKCHMYNYLDNTDRLDKTKYK